MVFTRKIGRDSRPTFYIWLPLDSGPVRWSVATTDRKLAERIERALRDLVDRHEFDLLHAIRDGRLTIAEVYEAHRHRTLEALRQRLDDVDLSPLVDRWLEVHGTKVSANTADYYRRALRRLMPTAEIVAALERTVADETLKSVVRKTAEHELTRARETRRRLMVGETFPVSRFRARELEPWLAGCKGSNESRRKAHAALSVFAAFLVRQGVLEHNPLRQLTPAKANAPRLRYLEVEMMIALANAQPEPYRSLSYFLHGTGADLSTALALTAGDVDLQRKEVRAAGTKSHARDRIVRVAEWAWLDIVTRRAELADGERLFPVDRWHARDAHFAACAKLGIENYWLRDARHSYAVRAARAGTPAELIAKQLGHVDATMTLRIYGRFMSETADRDRWELRASALDAERAERLKQCAQELAEQSTAATGTTPNTTPAGEQPENAKSPNPMGLDDFEDSRGGTRTRDPGIMSAVL